MGALLVGVSFAKSFAMGLDIPLIDVNHMHGHILAHFLQPSAQHPAEFKEVPSYPFLCLTVSGGHTQIVKVSSPFEHKYLGQTIDDAAGEAFDKTAILYFVRDEKVKDAEFVEKNLDDICASVQKTIVEILMKKVNLAIEQTGITEIAIAGGVSANSGLRNAILSLQEKGCNVYIPAFEYCTDNAAMIAIAGYYKYLRKDFAGLDVTPIARY